VATAGHCLNSGPEWGNLWSTHVRVYPGRNGSSSPYGSCGAKKLWTVKGWTKDGDERFDFGAIKLDCTIGTATGWYGFFWQAESLSGYISATRGYPNDKAYGTQWLSTDCSDTSEFIACKIAVTQKHQLFYDNDTAGGQSGSPVYVKRSGTCRPCVMAIHGYALHGVYPHNTYNHGARITQSLHNFLLSVVNT
jgi:glutamyl endopeptidase